MQVGLEELMLDGSADDVPRARRYAAAALRGGPAEPLIGDVELIVSELVTNALLHAGAPASLRVFIPRQPTQADADELVVRVEVRDALRNAPIRAIASTEAMTGRGIALVEALASSWGVRPESDGKLVWSEVSLNGPADAEFRLPDFDVDALLAAWEDEPAEQQITVRLGDVPTELLLAAKAHVDNLVREFTLASSGAVSGTSAAVPAHLAELVDNVVHRFAEPRLAIKRQAIKAAAAGLDRTDLVLTLTPANVEAGEDYLHALDEADGYARAARLLTLETPPQHRIFRRWYVESLLGQVAAALRGEVTPAPTFEDRLLQEIDRLTVNDWATERAARLQEVTASLAAATTPDDVGEVVVDKGGRELGAYGGCVMIRQDDEPLTLLAGHGYSNELIGYLRRHVAETQLSGTTDQVWIETRQERDERLPQLGQLEPRTNALCAVPLALGGRSLGVLRFSFDTPRLFDEQARRFVLSLAAQTALALDRSLLLVAETQARAKAEGLAERLSRLQRVTAEVSSADDAGQVGDIVVTNTAEALGATSATVFLVNDDNTMQQTHQSGAPTDVARRPPSPIEPGTPICDAVLSGEAVVVPGGGELGRRYPTIGRRIGATTALVVVPMRAGGTVLGTLGLTFSQDEHALDEPSVVSFLQTIGDAAGQAIRQDRAFAASRAANDKLSFLADASALMSGQSDISGTLTSVAQLAVPRLADLCALHLVEGGQIRTVALSHVPSERLEAVARRDEEFPTDPFEHHGVGRVLRTGTSELRQHVTDADLVVGAPDERRLAVDAALGMSSVLLAPMIGRTGVIGAIELVYTVSGRHYDLADQSLAEDLGRRVAVGIENAAELHQQRGRLAAITRVAEAAHHAILAPVPSRVGPLLLRAAYESASHEALLGGDLYEVVPHANGVRLLIGDVRGKGLDAVRIATIALGEFRASAADEDELERVAVRLDRRLTRYLAGEDFVTALILEVGRDGSCQMVCCGHPPAIFARRGRLHSLQCAASVPLGLGAQPVACREQLEPGDRLLLFTDGLVEARRPDGRFVDLAAITAPVGEGELESVLTRVLDVLHQQVGPDLGDDLALVLAEFQPNQAS